MSDPTRTILDLLDTPALGGGIRSVLDMLKSYHSSAQRGPKLLIRYAEQLGNKAVFKRLGFLVATFAPNETELIAEIGKTCRHFYDEGALRKVLGDSTEVPEAAIPMGGFNLIVEAKAGLFDDSLMAIGDPEIFRHKTRALAKAVRQGWSASVAFRKPGSPADLRNGMEDYLFVVTNKPVNVRSGADLQSIYPEGEVEYPTEEAKALLPLERTYFVSVDEFERLIASASDTVSLHAFLRETVRLDANPATGKAFFDDHLQTFPGPKESTFLTNALQEGRA